MLKILGFLFDFVFPRNKEEMILENLSGVDIFEKIKKTFRHLPGTYSLFNYKDRLAKELVWQIKFKGNKKYAKFCGKYLYRLISEKNRGDDFLLIPIPLHKKRLAERGYNQTEWLCQEIIKHNAPENLKYSPKILFREKYQIKQSWMDKESRIKNIQGIFEVKYPEMVSNKNIILIDDVVTTGTTLNEARRTLKESGAKSVTCFTIAH